MKKKLELWFFLPNSEDLSKDWQCPINYFRAAFGEIRFRLASDTPMDDPAFEPGWKRSKEVEANYDIA